MRKHNSVTTLKRLLCIISLLAITLETGCGGGKRNTDTSPKEDSLTLVWAANPYYFGANAFDLQIQEELNRRLIEDYNCDFQVQFEWLYADGNEYQTAVAERYQSRTATDILFTGLANHGQPGTYNSMVRDDLLYPLDDFLTETEAGQVLYASFSEMFWQAMRCEGHIYGFRCVDPQMYYDATLLVREDYSSALQQYEEISSIQDLGDILEHLSKTSPDSLQDTLGVYVDIDALCNLEGYIPVINGYTGLYFTEENGTVRVINAADDASFLNMWKEIQRCNNVLTDSSVPDAGTAYRSGKYVFAILPTTPRILYDDQLLVDTQPISVKTLRQAPEPLIYARNAVTGIASWSEHPKEAMELLSLIATQPDLSNLLIYGIEGIHYNLAGGIPVPVSSGNAYTKLASPANRTISYRDGLEPADKTILYQEKNSAAVLSPEIQYELDYTEYIEELSEISAVYEAHACLWLGTCSDVEAEAEKLSQELQAVDVDKLVKKLNKMLGN
jgi:putative aldouronate transport system substrate-binding protein